jgi:polyphosphate kinase 2 (PPK2 family)
MKSTVVKARPGDKICLSKIDPDDTGGMSKEKACTRFADLREEVSLLQGKLFAEHERNLLILFQAMDTGGKDGVLKALCFGLNPAGLEVARFKGPTQAELDHDFLWRAHKMTPNKGMIGAWNRSHYEDVLVVRVHKLVPKKVWKARCDQINSFEKILSENGTTIVKFMLHISPKRSKRNGCKHASRTQRSAGSFRRPISKSARYGTIIRKLMKTRSIAARPITPRGT